MGETEESLVKDDEDEDHETWSFEFAAYFGAA